MKCTKGTCIDINKITCYSNTDCELYGGICNNSTLTCIIDNFYKNQALYKCIARNCNGSVMDCCPEQYVANVCSKQCSKRADYRTVDDGYIYDCTSLTRKLQPKNTCEIRATVINCKPPVSQKIIF